MLRNRSPDAVIASLAGLIVWFVVLVAFLTPWNPLPGAPSVTAHVRDFFSPAQIRHTEQFHNAIKWSGWLGLVTQLITAYALGFTRVGRLLFDAIRRVTWRWWFQTVLVGAAFIVVQVIVGLPFAIWAQHITNDYGLTTGSWWQYTTDTVKGVAVSITMTDISLMVIVGLARRYRNGWAFLAAGLAAVAVVVSSFVYPVVFEPLFTHFTPLAHGPLRTRIVKLAAQSHVNVDDVLVARASERTTAENAYVTGFGATKRVVLYDTLVKSAPRAQVEMVIAHELGHVKHHDVRNGTAEGAVGAGAAMLAFAVLLRRRRIRAPLRIDSMRDPSAALLALSLLVLATFLASPIEQGLSRKIEAHADAHALELTNDPSTFIAMQKRLALSNLDHLDPNPVLSFWFDSHPTTMDRIAMALAYERMQRER
jgi:STE24 endopeptidase